MTSALAAPIFALIAVLAWRRLVAKGYSCLVASAIVTLALVQLAICMGERNAFFAAVLGLGIYAIPASAFSLARDQSVRGIIRAGCALAGAQLIMPFGGLFTAAILPALIAIPKSADGRAKSLGVLVLLLFMPALAAASLWATQFHSFTVGAPNGFSIRDFVLDAFLLVFFSGTDACGFSKAAVDKFDSGPRRLRIAHRGDCRRDDGLWIYAA
jgi:hypothetical protein